MIKRLAIFFICFLSIPAYADSLVVTLSNPAMVALTPDIGAVTLQEIDAFNPSSTCSTFSSPNTCTMIGSDTMKVQYVFNYLVSLVAGSGSVDILFSLDNGISGTANAYNSATAPSDIFGLGNNDSGTISLELEMLLKGTGAKSNYGAQLNVDVVYNP